LEEPEADLHQQGKVNPISAMTNIIKIHGEKVVVNAHEIFTRIAGIINTSSDMAGYLKYELVSQPPSLFDNVSMRKANKASPNSTYHKDIQVWYLMLQSRHAFRIHM